MTLVRCVRGAGSLGAADRPGWGHTWDCLEHFSSLCASYGPLVCPGPGRPYALRDPMLQFSVLVHVSMAVPLPLMRPPRVRASGGRVPLAIDSLWAGVCACLGWALGVDGLAEGDRPCVLCLVFCKSYYDLV